MKKLEIGIEVVPSHAFGRSFVEGVSKFAAQQKDWKLRALQQETATNEALRKCDGVIMRAFGDSLDKFAASSGIPVVDVNCETDYPHLAQISVDESACGKMAAEFFLSRRYPNFGFCGISSARYSDSLRDAFCKALHKAGFPTNVYTPSALLPGSDYDNPYRAPDRARVLKWLKSLPKPIAICCSNDNRAYQVMDIALKAGMAIPNDVAILGCDNDAMLCTFAPVPISSIDSDPFKLGYSAARILDALIRRRQSRKAHRPYWVSPKAIVERESTEHYPIDPPWLSDALLLIEKDLSRGVAARDVFELSGHSPPHVEKTFKQHLGVSVQTYITTLRMKKALSLLNKRQLSAKEVAFACGYASPQYFSRAFKDYYGKSPLSSTMIKEPPRALKVPGTSGSRPRFRRDN